MSLKLMRHENIRQILICFMKELGLWEEEMKDEIPRSFKKYGDHLLFSEAAFANRNWYEAGNFNYPFINNVLAILFFLFILRLKFYRRRVMETGEQLVQRKSCGNWRKHSKRFVSYSESSPHLRRYIHCKFR